MGPDQDAIIRVADDGRFRRKKSEFRDWISADADSGARFTVEPGRYHLYVAWACPWAHRTLLARTLLGLDEVVSVSTAHWLMDGEGAWHFKPDEGYVDELHGSESIEDVYRKADPEWPGIGTVPVLWDKREGTIVNNESREILRMLATEFRSLQTTDLDLSPKSLRDEIDVMIDANYESVNNGVYKSGFARTQEAYDEAVEALFDRLDELEAHLNGRDYLVTDHITEADVCLFPTLVRFDAIYHHHFKCNKRMLRDYPHLWAYTKRIARLPGVQDTMDLEDTRKHYFKSHTSINPHRIVPTGPDVAELFD